MNTVTFMYLLLKHRTPDLYSKLSFAENIGFNLCNVRRCRRPTVVAVCVALVRYATHLYFL